MSAYYATGEPAMATGAQPGHGTQLGGGGELSWRLILSGAARKLMAGFLVLGVLFSVGCSATAGTAHSNGVSAANATNQVQANTTPVTDAVNNYSAYVKACKGQLTCVTQLDRQVAATFNTFAEQLRATRMPSKATAANAALVASVLRAGAIYARLGAAASPTQYINAAKAADLDQALNQVNQAYANLGTALRS